MPGWLRLLARLNPLTYLVDALRGLMIAGGESVHGYGTDVALLVVSCVVLQLIAVRLYPTLVE
jgi:ABC-2 type transport system permease protein